MQDPFNTSIDRKYLEKLDQELDIKGPESVSASFQAFEDEEVEQSLRKSFYERYANTAQKYLPFVKVSSNNAVAETVAIADINVTPSGVLASAALTFIIFLVPALLLLLISTAFAFFFLFTGMFLAWIAYSMPTYLAQVEKIKAQQESILAILYISIYMKVSPVLENAIFFAVQHLNGPLSRDLKRLLWLVDTGRAPDIEKGTETFIPLWAKRNPNFIKAFLTLHGVLSQTDQESKDSVLNRALDLILNETYEDMKHYAHDLKMPVVVLQLMGLMLPLIGLIMFPMISIFLSDSFNISYLFFGYIVVLPAIIFFLSNRIISKRPGAFSVPDIKDNPYLPKEGTYRLAIGKKTFVIPIVYAAVFVALIIMLPGLLHLATGTYPAYAQGRFMEPGQVIPEGSPLAEEYGLSAMLLTLTIPLGLAVGLIMFFRMRSVQRLEMRNKVLEIEDDLGDSLFALGKQFSKRIPVEQAMIKFIQEYEQLNLKKKSIYFFFTEVINQMRMLGATFSDAIFNKEQGVILAYPSVLLREIVWIIVEAAKKGSKVLYDVTSKISSYLVSVKKIKELLYDLLAETVTSINVQAKFLAPFLSAVVGSLTFVIIISLFKMSQQLEKISTGFSGDNMQGTVNFFGEMANFAQITPPTVFQVLVGIYMIEAVVLLSGLANGVENGFDRVSQDMTTASNLTLATVVYTLVAIVGTVISFALVESLTAVS